MKLWLDRCHSYRALVRLTNKLKELNTTNLKQIKDANPANIYRAAERCGINNSKEIASNELYLRYKSCEEQTRRLMAQSPWMRKRFLSEKLTDLIDRKKTEEAKKSRTFSTTRHTGSNGKEYIKL